MREREAIIGCGAISAVGGGVGALRVAMRNNATGLHRAPRFDSPRFQSSVVGAVPLDALASVESDDPAWLLATAALREARDEAHPVLSAIPSSRISLVLSTTKANVEALQRAADRRPCSDTARRHLRGDLLAADLAAEYGAGGPVQCVSLACVSGLVAIQQGAKLIQRGTADAVFVVGVDHLSAFVVAGFSALKALDPKGCRPFDRDRAGLSPGEAGAALVLVRASLASGLAAQSPRRPLITVRGWGSTNDANHLTGPSRDGAGLAAAIRVALNSADLRPDQIDYVNAHGTGTPYNDAMETLALTAVFGAQGPPLSGSKGMLGHTLGAAGVLETILCVLAMRENVLPGTPGLGVPTDGAPASLLRDPHPAVSPRHILKLNTGFGGVNGALVLSHE
jgi:3-oxoacyl-[acyl-carrier-protein] synthase II